jgi:ATP-dependent DNA helicase RecG
MNNLKFLEEVKSHYEFDSIHEMIYELIPRAYNVPAAFASLSEIPTLPDKTKVTVYGFIEKFDIKPSKGRIAKIKAKVYKDGEAAHLSWTCAATKTKGMIFGLSQNIYKKDQKNPMNKELQLVQVSGKISSYTFDGGDVFKFIEQPTITPVDVETKTSLPMTTPEPIYKLKSDMKLNTIKLAFKELISNFDSIDQSSFMPIELEKELGLQPLFKSMEFTHGLKSIPNNKFLDFLNYPGFKKRLLIEKIWRIMNKGFNTEDKGSDFKRTDEDINNIKELISKLEFDLTGDQKKAIWAILSNIETKSKSKNLVFGDVGSGKTMVALILGYVFVKRGYQVALLAPTSILAKQHYEEALELFGDENIYLVHSKTKKKEKDSINKNLSDGQPAMVFGTSSLNKLEYTNLKLTIIDEEQKFGVHDKERLFNNHNTNLILMTATPIPRTLAGAMFSDFLVQKIEEKPAMQKPRITKVCKPENLSESELSFIKDKMKEGQQMLVIVPAIMSNEMVSVKSAKLKYEKLFSEFKVDTINGRMKPANVEKVTETFMQGGIDIMIATTMVDAGFSNKTLSFVFIENADRFGIAQLHQIRGRVGRGSYQGYCYLAPSTEHLKEKTRDRMNALVESENGFELSMKDIEQRGSGDLIGTEQSGSDVNLLEWLNEVETINNYLKNNVN